MGLVILAVITTAPACPNAEPWFGAESEERPAAAPRSRETRSTSNNGMGGIDKDLDRAQERAPFAFLRIY